MWNMVILLDFLSDLPPLTDRKRFFFFSVEGGANSKACKYLISLLNSRRPSSLTLPNFFPFFDDLFPLFCKGVGQWSFPFPTPPKLVYISLASVVLLTSAMV